MGTDWELSDGYGMRQKRCYYQDPEGRCACQAEEEAGCRRSVRDRILGLTTMAVVSAGGWTAIIALARLFK